MDVLVCAGCGAELSVPVERVALPPEAHASWGHGPLPPLMEPGTYAVDPAPAPAPWRTWEDLGESAAAAAGVYAPVYPVPCGTRNRMVLAPGDMRGTRLVPERCESHCLGITAGAEPNLVCLGCGLGVGSREDDCGLWQTVWYEPGAVVRRPLTVPAPAPPPPDRTPPLPTDDWDLRLAAAAGAALAGLLTASGGGALALPDGPVTELFGRELARLLPAGPPARRVGLAGPGLPGDGADLVLVPADRRTGAPWPPADDVVAVALPYGVWAHLALPETSPMPPSGRPPAGVLRDDYPLPDHAYGGFGPDPRTLRRTLARMPEVRRPWLRALYDRL
ncbi:hypothetical protein SNE510_39490 [Streptomyces sp. NE5-10]|uniref:hypothetical protein n=1 Tax=Streptomyces sp. NE5-10 TaxID=2759674 RepID=UPI00190879D4|nr:hypothetical protein [Streptomyces sp. NE5-10]GHJ94430.1 hypothetical protein SNE510_39490 [Streptomyces sp. NE5-10]